MGAANYAQCTQSPTHILAVMRRAVIVSSERVDANPAGPGLRALGLAQGLAAHAVDVTIAAPVTAAHVDGIPTTSLDDLPRAVDSATAVIVPAALVHAYPEVLAASALCVDFAGPFPLEAEARGADAATISAAERAAVFAIANADIILCAHDRQRTYARDLALRHGRPLEGPESRIALVPFGVPIIAPRTSESDGGPLRIVWPGGLWDWLDPLLAVDALARASEPMVLEFWGTQNPDPEAPRMRSAESLAERVRVAGLGERVRLVDWIPRDRFDERLAEFDVAITFDSAGREAHHAFRTRLLHALACGVPTIATRGEFVADLAAERSAGWTIPAGDTVALADLFDRLSRDRIDLERASEHARVLAGEFTYPSLVEPIVRWLEDEDRFRLPSRERPRFRSRVRRVLRKTFG